MDIKTNNQSEKTKKIVYITLVAIVVLALGGLAGFLIGQNNKQQEVEQARQEAAQQQAQPDSAPQPDERPAHEKAPAKTTTETTCNADELALALGEGSGAAGTFYYPITFTNTSDRTCTLFGYPGVSLVNDNGNQIGQPAERAPADEATVTLAPGQVAQSNVGVPNSGNFPAGQCEDGATKLRVYPPNDTGYLSVASGNITSWCPGFSVSPVVAM